MRQVRIDMHLNEVSFVVRNFLLRFFKQSYLVLNHSPVLCTLYILTSQSRSRGCINHLNVVECERKCFCKETELHAISPSKIKYFKQKTKQIIIKILFDKNL